MTKLLSKMKKLDLSVLQLLFSIAILVLAVLIYIKQDKLNVKGEGKERKSPQNKYVNKHKGVSSSSQKSKE